MKSSFSFDGEILRLRLTVGDTTEVAVAKLMESFTIASVDLEYENRYSGYQSDPKAVVIYLRKPAELGDQEASGGTPIYT